MERWSLAACTIAQPMRWVKLTFFGAIRPFSALRRRSRMATSTSRKLVAVGTARLATMFWTSRADGPLIGVAPSGTDAAAGAAAGAGFADGAVGMGSAGAGAGGADAWPLPEGPAAGAETGSKPATPESKGAREGGSTLVGAAR